MRETLDEIGSGVFSPDDPGRYRGLVETLTHHDYFMVCADFDAYWATQMKVDAAWRDRKRLAALQHHQYSEHGLVLVRSHDRRICDRDLERPVPADCLRRKSAWPKNWRAARKTSTPSRRRAQDDPFAVLGPHLTPDGWVIRAFVPDAIRVRVLTREGAPIAELERRKGDFFEALLPHVEERPTYRIEATRVTGVSSYEDAYAFGPALGPMDDHLLVEGTHRQLYKRLGAQITAHEGAGGVVFAVWAPQRAPGFGRRRLQRMGRTALPDAQAHRQRSVGNLHSRIWAQAPSTNTKSFRPAAIVQPLKADPYRLRGRAAALDRLGGRLHHRFPLE